MSRMGSFPFHFLFRAPHFFFLLRETANSPQRQGLAAVLVSSDILQ